MLETSLSQKIIRNTAFNILGRFWKSLAVLFLCPFIIRHVGVERMGVWAIVGVITGYFGLFDFGFTTSSIKYIAEFYGKKDFKKINEIIITSFISYFLFSLFLVIAVYFVSQPILKAFKVPPQLYAEALFVFLTGVFVFCCNNIFSPFVSLQLGLQKMGVNNAIEIGISSINVACVIFFLKKGFGLRGLMLSSVVACVVGCALNVFAAFKIFPSLRLRFSFLHKDTFNRLFTFGYKMQILNIATFFHFQMDKILLGYFLGFKYATYYLLASQVAQRIREVPLFLTTAMVPFASELSINPESGNMKALYFRSTKYIFLIGLPMIVAAIFYAKPFFVIWLGGGYEMSVITLQILLLGYLFGILSSPCAHIFIGMEMPHYVMIAALLAIATSLLLNILLVVTVGYLGVVIGTFTSFVIGSSYLFVKFYPALKLSVTEIAKRIIFKVSFACALALLCTYYAARQQHLTSWLSLSIQVGAFFLFFTLFILLLRYFDAYDKELFYKIILRIKLPVKV